jgi:Protein of unknown function (DUF2384)
MNRATNNNFSVTDRKFNPEDEEKKVIIRKALINACKILGFNQKDLSSIIGFSESKASRLFKNNAYIEPSTKEWDLAILFLRMYRSLDSLFGGHKSQCRLWINSNNSYLQGAPRELIKKIEGLVEVTQYLDAYRGLA